MPKRAFVSHISDEGVVATALKNVLRRDFLGLLDVFVSSDEESIAAGEDWLHSIERALKDSGMLVVLCSPDSVTRPWINFEAGAAWMRGIPLVPVCHAGLRPSDLPMPLSLRHGILLDDPEGVRRLYTRIADLLECQIPTRSFEDLCKELASVAVALERSPTSLSRERAIRTKLKESLQHPRYRWRSLGRLAFEAAISEESAADYLRGESDVRFAKGRSGEVIVGLRSRVGDA